MGRRIHLLVIAGYIVATVVMTWPVAANMSTHVAGDGGDSLQNIWNLWWVEKTVGGEDRLYFTDYLFHPHGVSLVFHTLSLANTLIFGLPLAVLTGDLVLTYNLLILLSFVLAGYGMFLLARYLRCDVGVAAVAGFAYAFAPYHLAQALGHLNLASIQWLPFFVLFYLKTFRQKGVRNPLLAAGFLALLALSSWQYLVLALIMGAVLFFHELRAGGRVGDRTVVVRFALFCLSFLVAAAPFALPLVRETLGGGYGLQAGGFSMISLLHYITPSPLHPVWGGAVDGAYPLNIADSTVFLGFTVLAFAGIYAARYRKRVRPWLLIAALFAVLSLSPNLLHAVFESVFPPFQGINNMERFGLGVLFPTVLVFSRGLQHYIPVLVSRVSLTRRQLLTVVFLVVAVEFMAVPYYTTEVRPLPAEVGVVHGAPANTTVVSIPPLYNSEALYLQTVHEKRMLGGYVSRTPSEATATVRRLAAASQRGDHEQVMDIMDGANVGFIIEYPHRDARYNLNLTRLPSQLPTTELYRGDRRILYRVQD